MRKSTELDEANDSPYKLDQEEEKTNRKLAACLRTPCILEGERVIAFVDSGADASFVSRKLVERMGWHVTP